MTKCSICNSNLNIVELTCDACHTSYKGTFYFPCLARLTTEEQHLVESLVEHGGNLKEMAEVLNLSYPTLKKRLNELADALKEKKIEDEKKTEKILKKIEFGEMSPEEGIKLIREINGEL
jgi:hypothetical protein